MFHDKGYSQNRTNKYLEKRSGLKRTFNQVKRKKAATAKAVKVAGNKIPPKNVVTRTLTIGPRVDYWWDANEAVAKLYGYDSIEEHIMKTHLDPEAVNYWNLYMKHMGYAPKATLSKLRRERKLLDRKLKELDDRIAEKEQDWASRRRQ